MRAQREYFPFFSLFEPLHYGNELGQKKTRELSGLQLTWEFETTS